jgi:hypothetical protein
MPCVVLCVRATFSGAAFISLAFVGVALVGVQADAFEVGWAGDEVVGLAHGRDGFEGWRAAAAGVQVDVGGVREGGEHGAGEIQVCPFRGAGVRYVFCIIAARWISKTSPG